MALPSNYKQIAVGAPTGPSAPTPSSGSRSRSSGAGSGSDRNKDTTPIFSHSNYGNPAFTPQKAGKTASSKTQVETRVPKPPKPPEKPVLPHMRYSKRMWDSVKEQYPELKLWELGKKIGDMWLELNDTAKQEFIDEYETDKLDYEKSLKAYHNSPAYQSYLAAKSKLRSDADVHETPSRASGKSSQERRIDIQPAEDEDDQDEGYSFKHLAYARYLRNHRLINEIFSDAVVPDVRSVVTTQRMQVLKRQVSSLTMHQTKLEAELQQMEEKFEAKKQRMVESSEAFQEELKRHCKPAVDEETLQKMVVRMYDEMKKQRLEEQNPNIANQATNKATEEKISNSNASSLTTNNTPGPTAAQGPSNTAKKENPPPVIQKSGNQENDSKTEPEPMDIEPPQKPSAPVIPKIENRQSDLSKSGKIHPEASKEPSKIVAPQKSIIQPTKAPTPTPTPPPPQQVPINPTESQPPPQQQTHGPPTTANAPPMGPQPTPPPPTTQQTQPQSQPQSQPPQPQLPPGMPMHPHHPRQPHPHLPPHMQQHQPPMSGMAPHPSYGNYGSPSGPTRSPYYQPQYGGHPSQPYGQYAYSHYPQAYGPPPGPHYINRPPPPQHNGSPVHYPEHGTPMVPQQPPPGHMAPHDPYQQVPQHPGPPQQPGMPPVGGPPGVPPSSAAPSMPGGPPQSQPASEPPKPEADKPDNE